MAFRFFINIDQCLNMNNFDFFFYKKRALNEFHVTDDVYIGEGTGLPFTKAAADIRLQIDKSTMTPHPITDYQIIIAMRSDIDYTATTVWRETLLSRLLDIDFYLRQSNIIIWHGGAADVAVNLIMLYEANVITNIALFDNNYMSDTRLNRDCQLLLKEIGVPDGKENDLHCLRECWQKYVNEHKDEFESGVKYPDGSYAHPLYVFFNNLLKQYEDDERHRSEKQSAISTLQALKEVLNGYQVFELITERNNLDIDINALLRIVEFSTTDFEVKHGLGGVTSLSEQCKNHWNAVKAIPNDEIRSRYGRLLYFYKRTLEGYVNRESVSAADGITHTPLPESEIPSDGDIGIKGNSFEEDQGSIAAQAHPKKQISQFRSTLSPSNDLMSKWEKTFVSLEASISEIDDSLKIYAGQLGDKYNQEIRKRKEEEDAWNNQTYLKEKETEQEIEQLTADEKKLLEIMGLPQMTPKLQFQDQLNMKTALDLENQYITQYVKCIESVRTKSFILLLVFILGIIAFHYIVLQPYNFSTSRTALYTMLYLLSAGGIMFFSWRFPLNHYKRKILERLDQLEEELDKYVKGFFERAKQFKTYINTLNKLDYVERHLRLKKNAVKTERRIVSAKSWHRSQAEEHIQKLKFFNGIIASFHPKQDEIDAFEEKIMVPKPEITKDHVDDVFQCSLYWPQQ